MVIADNSFQDFKARAIHILVLGGDGVEDARARSDRKCPAFLAHLIGLSGPSDRPEASGITTRATALLIDIGNDFLDIFLQIATV
jgi:hypothetical protein